MVVVVPSVNSSSEILNPASLGIADAILQQAGGSSATEEIL
jgi:hypothetical protein